MRRSALPLSHEQTEERHETNRARPPSPTLDDRRAAVVGISISAAAVVVGGAAFAQRSSVDSRRSLRSNAPAPSPRAAGRAGSSSRTTCTASRRASTTPRRRCEVAGSLFVRAQGGGALRDAAAARRPQAEGIRQLTAVVPDSFVAAPDGFEYYAELERVGTGDRLLVPPGGEAAPYRSRVLKDTIDVDLGVADFSTHRRGARLASARWGDGTELRRARGWKERRPCRSIRRSTSTRPARCSCSIRSTGECCVGRVARSTPARVPVSIDGRIADLAISDDGSLYVLESVARPGRSGPLVRRFDETGRELDVVEAAERSPSQIRVGPDGPVVLEHPSHQWTPMALDGYPLPPNEQRRRARSGRPASIGRRGDRPSHGERASTRRDVWRPRRALVAADERDAARRGPARRGRSERVSSSSSACTPRAPTSSGSSFSIGMASRSSSRSRRRTGRRRHR